MHSDRFAYILSVVIIVGFLLMLCWAATNDSGVSGFTQRPEKLEVYNVNCTYGVTAFNGTDKGWNISITLKNSGSSDAEIESLLVN